MHGVLLFIILQPEIERMLHKELEVSRKSGCAFALVVMFCLNDFPKKYWYLK
jgi:hypothetical protein